MKHKVEKAESEAKNKYSKVLENFKNTKKMIRDIVDTFVFMKKEQQALKLGMMSLSNMIPLAMKDAQKSVSYKIAVILPAVHFIMLSIIVRCSWIHLCIHSSDVSCG